jgi:predicted phosphohydrolase
MISSVQIVSDLHIEFNNDNVPDPLKYIIPTADILILAGDIGSLYKINQLYYFLSKLCSYFQIVLYVPGNHEWYRVHDYQNLSITALENRLNNLPKKIPNLHILNRSSVRIGNVCIAGATLWSEPECQVPPFIVRIHDMNTKDYKEKHYKDLAYLKNIMKYCEKNTLKLIVITHHPPSKKVLDIAKKRKKFDSLYATDLEYLLDKTYVDTWICGHVHKNFDFLSDKGCRVVSNQKGKPKDNITDFSKKFIIEI